MTQKKLVFITGWATWIGNAASSKFASEWYDVAVNFLKNFRNAEKLENEFSNLKSFQWDMSKQDEVESIFNKIKEHFWRYPDILINNAAIVHRVKYPELDWDAFLRIMDINTVWPYRVSREFALRNKWNMDWKSIVFIWSMRGLMQSATTIDYSATKAAVHNMTVTLAKTFSPCRVNCVVPWFTKTPMHEGNYERLDKEAENSILKRYSNPEDIADSIFFMAWDQARAITWELLVVDNWRSLMS